MPGARAGFCFCYNSLCIENMIKIQQACTANASIISQEGLRATLTYIMENPKTLQTVAQHYLERTRFATKRLNEIGQKYLGSDVAKQPTATFYIFADFGSLKQLDTDIQLQQYLRDQYKSNSIKTGKFLYLLLKIKRKKKNIK